MSNYLSGYGTAVTPQSEAIPGSPQVENSGGYSFQVDDFTRLRRFLVLGSEGGSYYATERKLTRDNADAVRRCIAEDGLRVVREILEVSDAGRAPKNTPAIFALALAASEGDLETRQAAFEVMPQVCRTGTHLFEFVGFIDEMRGWGRAARRGVSKWYTEKEPDQIAYQVVKYRQRNGWTHRDVLRLAHPHPDEVVGAWIVGKEPRGQLPEAIEAFERAQRSNSPKETAILIREYGSTLPREALKPEHLTEAEVWQELLYHMPPTALIRNLATMTRVGLIKPLAEATRFAVGRIDDAAALQRARVHPIQVLAALVTYAAGQGARGQHFWSPVSAIVDALDRAFYTTFGNVEPANKRTVLALDVSSSMNHGEVAGVPGLSPRVASAALSLVTAATEPDHEFVAFTASLVPVEISSRQRLDDVVRKLDRMPFGGTDCSLPMLDALERDLEVDTFVVLTDSETWAGSIHPSQALQKYRRATGIDARLVVVGMVGNEFTLADPRDAGMLDVVGFDTATPNLISAFSRGEL